MSFWGASMSFMLSQTAIITDKSRLYEFKYLITYTHWNLMHNPLILAECKNSKWRMESQKRIAHNLALQSPPSFHNLWLYADSFIMQEMAVFTHVWLSFALGFFLLQEGPFAIASWRCGRGCCLLTDLTFQLATINFNNQQDWLQQVQSVSTSL